MAHLRACSRGSGPFCSRSARVVSLQILHDQVVDAVVLAHVVEGADVGVGEAGDGLGLPLEALSKGGVGGELRGEDLQGDGAVQAGVLRPVHLAHPHGADRLQNLESSESSS